jgi:hypothetical protein
MITVVEEAMIALGTMIAGMVGDVTTADPGTTIMTVALGTMTTVVEEVVIMTAVATVDVVDTMTAAVEEATMIVVVEVAAADTMTAATECLE